MAPKYASLDWVDQQPKSTLFDDIYLNTDYGLTEKQYVFVEGNRIPERVTGSLASPFVVAETGFGTGSNLLCTLETIQRTAPHWGYPIHFLSYELYPIARNDLVRIFNSQPTLSQYTNQLLDQYPPAIEGMHRFIFDNGRFYLTLFFGDAASGIQKTLAKVDAWYLDGFAPAKNPQMWNSELYRQIATLSQQQTTLATFTSAGDVRRGLLDAGFLISKKPGFGKKREMITATFNRPDQKAKPSIQAPWFSIPTPQKPKTAIIIGAGLAGCTTAEALARRGIAVTLIDTHADICYEASGNKQGALYAKLPITPTKSGEFHLCGLEYSLRLLKIYDCLDDKTASQCGLLQLATTERELERQQATLNNGHYAEDVVRSVSVEQASELSGNLIDRPALFFPRAGWVYPKAFCERLVENDLITMQLSTTVTSINKNDDKGWQLVTENQQIFSADILVVCTAAQAKSFELLNHLPVKPIRGQVSTVAASNQSKLKTVVCGDGYISPALEGSYSFGATFDLHDQSESVREADHISNVAMLKSALPTLAEEIEQLPWTAKVGYRCSTPDYLPITGYAPIAEEFRARYAKLADDKNWKFPDIVPPLHEGLLVNIGHGSKGLITAPLCAELLASLVANEPLPVPRDIYQALHPGRFLIKNLIRNK